MRSCLSILFFIFCLSAAFTVYRQNQTDIMWPAIIFAVGFLALIGNQKRDWRSDPVTQKQLDFIDKLDGDVDKAKKMTKGEASAYIDGLKGD